MDTIRTVGKQNMGFKGRKFPHASGILLRGGKKKVNGNVQRFG